MDASSPFKVNESRLKFRLVVRGYVGAWTGAAPAVASRNMNRGPGLHGKLRWSVMFRPMGEEPHWGAPRETWLTSAKAFGWNTNGVAAIYDGDIALTSHHRVDNRARNPSSDPSEMVLDSYM
jgi:hypothetical protein